ncbi:MAG: FeoB-associated Cys-rich membrane protein [Verrucomicrobiota bacterium]
MNTDWQSLAAIALVLLTAAALLRRWLRRKLPGSCRGACGSCGESSHRKN